MELDFKKATFNKTKLGREMEVALRERIGAAKDRRLSRKPYRELVLEDGSIEYEAVDNTDYLALVSSKNANYEMYNPFSGESRAVCELYGVVMIKLLFIFFCLFCLAFYVFIQIASIYISNWDKFKSVAINEKRIIGPSDLFLATLKDSDVRKSGTYGLPPKEQMPIHYWFTFRRYVTTGIPAGVTTIGNKPTQSTMFGIFSSASNSYHVYYSKLEFLWTLLPCIVLLCISLPSFTLALALDESHKPVSWIKVLANQWFWVYESSTYGENIVIYSNIVYGQDLSDNSLRAIEADAVVTLVNNKYNRVLVTSADVIHCWAVPALGIKIDACPGRINTISIMPTKCGVFYGQCSEICGVNHGFMPIVVEVTV